MDLSVAYNLAKERHKGQKYGYADYFDFHIEGVYRLCKESLRSIGISPVSELGFIILSVAYLHDILEDTNTTEDELMSLFGGIVTDAVRAISKEDNEIYDEYLTRVKSNPISLIVKICDVEFNLDKTNKSLEVDSTNKRMLKLKTKYEKAQKYLKLNGEKQCKTINQNQKV